MGGNIWIGGGGGGGEGRALATIEHVALSGGQLGMSSDAQHSDSVPPQQQLLT